MASKFALTMTSVLVVAASAMATPATLELRIVSTNGLSVVDVHSASALVDVVIQGRLTGGATGGLAMWMANVKSAGTATVDLGNDDDFFVYAPEVIAAQFERGSGFTNPDWGDPPMRSGYGGTATDATDALWQLGGGQNTMGNTNGFYPVGTVSMGVANSGWTDLAIGNVHFAGSLGESLVLSLDGAFAATIDTGETSAPYKTSPTRVEVVGSLTIQRNAELLAAYSVGLHDNATTDGWYVQLPINLGTDASTVGLSEPRLFATGANDEDLWMRLVFAEDIASTGVTVAVTPEPGADLIARQGASADEINLYWDGQPTIDLTTNGFAYQVALSGHASGQFGIAFIPGDVNGSGFVNGGDSGVVVKPGNWMKMLCDVGQPRADLDRGGSVNGVDLAVVSNTDYWSKPLSEHAVAISPSSDPVITTCP